MAETQVTLDPSCKSFPSSFVHRHMLTSTSTGSMRRHPGHQWLYSPFALAALLKRRVWLPTRAGAGDWAQASALRCGLSLRRRLRQPGCDRDEYPSSASAGCGESTDAVTWNVACNEPWVGDVRAIVHPLGGLHRRRVVNGEPSSKGMSPSLSLATVILSPARKLSDAPSSGGPRQVPLVERGDIVRSRSEGD